MLLEIAIEDLSPTYYAPSDQPSVTLGYDFDPRLRNQDPVEFSPSIQDQTRKNNS